jgi:DNA-3-methyladenine glycosylase
VEALPAAFYDRPVLDVARDLVGCELVHGPAGGVIVETEAYHESEPACHAHIGVTARTHVLFRAPGTAYVYRSYGIHALANIVVEPAGVGAAVLLRALEPIEGLEVMALRRGRTRPRDLCSGPGKLTQALGIELIHNDTSVRDGPIRLGPPPRGWERPRLVTGPRVGITKAADLPWRFAAAESIHVSRPWPPGMRVPQGATPSS